MAVDMIAAPASETYAEHILFIWHSNHCVP